jgi:GNAT superfamily N-acetyltransferase
MTTLEHRIREATRADMSAMKHIRDGVTENALVSAVIDLDAYEQALFHDGKGWVCEVDGQVVGFSCGRLVHGDVWALFLDAAQHGRGIGNALIAHVERWMFDSGRTEIVLSTAPGTRAERLYRRRGWVETGRTPSGAIEFSLTKLA